MSDIVNKLLTKTPFAQLTYEDKLQIVKIGRPQPSLLELNVNVKKITECILDILVRPKKKN
jgi:hypothetical protein